MKIYNYDIKTGEYLGAKNAFKNPLEIGKYLIPANATKIAPPKFNATQVAIFKNDVWQILPDFRGRSYWLNDNQKITIDKIGDIIPRIAKLTEPITKIPSLKELKIEAKAKIENFATATRFKITKTSDAAKMAGWVQKADRAKRIKLGTVSDFDNQVIDAEVKNRGKNETPMELAEKQLIKSKKLNMATSIIDGLESAALDAVDLIKSKIKLDELLVNLKDNAEKELAIISQQ